MYFHKLFNPHCPVCLAEELKKQELINQRLEINNHCDTCDVLQHELELMRVERDRLLKQIIEPPQVINQARQPDAVLKPIQTSKHLAFSARRQMLEQADREKAAAQRRAEMNAKEAQKITTETKIIGDKEPNQTIEELEKELDIEIENA